MNVGQTLSLATDMSCKQSVKWISPVALERPLTPSASPCALVLLCKIDWPHIPWYPVTQNITQAYVKFIEPCQFTCTIGQHVDSEVSQTVSEISSHFAMCLAGHDKSLVPHCVSTFLGITFLPEAWASSLMKWMGSCHCVNEALSNWMAVGGACDAHV